MCVYAANLGATVPLKKTRVRYRVWIRRDSNTPPFKWIVAVTVAILISKFRADAHPQVRRDSEIPLVKQSMQVSPQQKPVGGVVSAAFGIRPNVCGVQNRQGMLSRDGTCPFVCLSNGDSERTLTEARAYQERRTKARFSARFKAIVENPGR
jgi:hypothetical protein